MNTEKRKAEIYKQLQALMAERDEIEREEAKRQNVIHVGKFFKCRNNYSLPQSPADYWWAYTKIVSLEDHGTGFRVFRFQMDKHGRLTVEYDLYLPAAIVEAGYVEIPRAEFANAYEQIVSDLKAVRY